MSEVHGIHTAQKSLAAAYVAAHRWVCGDEGVPPFVAEDVPQVPKECLVAIGEQMFPLPNAINKERDVRALLARVIVFEGIGLGFHPDTPFIDYITTENKVLYDRDSAVIRDMLIGDAENFFLNEPGKLYELSMELWHEVYGVC